MPLKLIENTNIINSNMINLRKLLLTFLSFLFLLAISPPSLAMDAMSADPGGSHDMFMVGSMQFTQDGEPLSGAQVTVGSQTRTTNDAGKAEFEDLKMGPTTAVLTYQGKKQEINVNVDKQNTLVTVQSNKWKEVPANLSQSAAQTQMQKMLLSVLAVLVCFGIALVLIKQGHHAHHESASTRRRNTRRALITVLLTLGTVAALSAGYQLINISRSGSQAFVASNYAAELSTIPPPQNVKAFGDDRRATITWDEPNNKGKIVGYVVRWGRKDGGKMTDSKQTIYDMVQIQPLDKGAEYMVSVQSVTGTIGNATRNGKTWSGSYANADGNYSPAVTVNVTETSARVDAMRSRLTGFFDDFNLPAGNLDESKWNTAYTACTTPGFSGTFINSQLHAHNQLQARSDYLDFSASGLPYCDRAAVSSRPRGYFDVSGATDANPALIEGDFDGVPRHRDAWYIDLIPTNSRLNGVPVDLEGHDDIFQADTNEPAGVTRIVENNGGLMIINWDANRKPHVVQPTSLNCPSWQGDRASLDSCDLSKKVTKYSPIPENNKGMVPVPNVQRHWTIEYSPSTISVLIDGVKVMSVKTPATTASQSKLQITSEVFAYTTGKEHEFDNPSIMPTTTLMHWDNFGFSGPAQSTIVHNYIDGGADGMSPQYGTGNYGKPVQKGNRLAKFNIPDQIGNPVQVRLMFTLGQLGNYDYTWSSSQNVNVNGHAYAFPNPNLNVPGGNLSPISSAYTPHSTGIIINAADLVTGMNSVQFNLNSDIINAHIEIEYTKGTETAFTQPQNIFTNLNYGSFITPVNAFNDSYLFIEQDMGLVIDPNAPVPTLAVSPTVQPSPTRVPTVIPTVTTRPTATPIPTAGPTSTPRPTAVPTAVPTSTPRPTATPTLPPQVTPTATPRPTAIPTPTTRPTAVPVGQSVVRIYAAGEAANGTYPTMKIQINGSNKKTWTVKNDFKVKPYKVYEYISSTKLTPSMIRVRFTNDYFAGGQDRNLYVDKIELDGVVYESEAPSILSNGVWNSTTGCAAGYKQSEELSCNGYFQY